MPQLSLELSSNVMEKDNLNAFLESCHSVLVNTLLTDINDCKSRIILVEHYYIGDGNSKHAFVHLNLRVLPGRSVEVLNKTANAVMDLLQNFFRNSLIELKLQITLELNELPKIYLKKTRPHDE